MAQGRPAPRGRPKGGNGLERLELRIHGRVQGVAFRWYARDRARALGLTGWVRNRADGSVQAVAEGGREALEAFRDWASRGPDSARVDHLEVAWSEAAGTFTHFEING